MQFDCAVGISYLFLCCGVRANLFGSPDVNVVRAVADAIREATEVVVHCSNLANSVKGDLKLEGMSRIVCASSPIGGGFTVQGIKKTWIGLDFTGLILVEVGGVKVIRQLYALYSKAASQPGTMRFLKLTAKKVSRRTSHKP